jgi:TolB-like protein/Tfp pilus assembly protein PilF
MKLCPTCERTYADETLQFCRVDGALLIAQPSGASESATRVFDQSRAPEAQSTELLRDTSESQRTTSALGVKSALPVSAETSKAPARGSANITRTGAISGRKLALIVTLIVILAIAGYVAYRHARNTEAGIESIAVLPFENQSHDPDSEYLSDGLTESIIYRLSQLPNLKVSPRSSVFRYKGKETDPVKVGNELGVNAVLSGRITQRSDQFTISTELTDVRYNKLLWGEQYDRKMTDLLATQREIAREITEKLKVKISGEDERLASKHYTESNEAYQSYLKGRFYWNRRTREGYTKALEHFNAAIAKDPSFALAYAGLADCYNVLSSYGISSPGESFPRAKAAATKALELDGNLAEARTSLAYYKYQYDWDWADAERQFKQAIELNPNYATAHHWYAITLAGMGRMDEALLEIKRAQELDPLSLVINASAGWIFYHAHRYDEALAQYRKSLDLDQNFARAHWGIAEPYVMKGEYESAVTELQAARQLDESPIVLALLGHAYAAAGRKGEAQNILNELKQQSKVKYVDSYFLAEIHAALGEKERALQELEDAYRERSSWLVWIKVEPKFDGLRSDPRFADLVRRVGL